MKLTYEVRPTKFISMEQADIYLTEIEDSKADQILAWKIREESAKLYLGMNGLATYDVDWPDDSSMHISCEGYVASGSVRTFVNKLKEMFDALQADNAELAS